MLVQPTTINNRETWNATLALMPYAHILQAWEWGDFKATTTGWLPERIAYMHQGMVVAMAQILTRKVGPLAIMYVPKGPALDYANQPLRLAILEELKRYAHKRGAIFLKVDPDIVTGVGVPSEPGSFEDPTGYQITDEWKTAGLGFSRDQVQFRNSMIIDLRRSENDLLASMKQKTRYNVRLAEKRGITTRFGTMDDLDLLYGLYVETAQRDNFIIRPLDYYRQAWGNFMQAGLAQPIIAEYKGKAIAHVIIFGFGKWAWYFYGASSGEERQYMPTYLLQWEAMRWAQAQDMAVYDFWGAPDNFDDENDPLSGVFRFKEGFGGIVVRRTGAWDYPTKPILYKLYTQIMPAVLGTMRGIGWRKLRGMTKGNR